jgi:putative ABC transport system permease protein
VIDTLTKDVVHAFRSLRKTPTFTVTAMLTIALGIGASATIFSVVNAVLLKPLPYPGADRLVYIWADLRNRDVSDFPWAPGDVWDTQRQGTMFEGVAGVFTNPTFLRAEGMEPESVTVANGTTNMLRVLGLRVAYGRDFRDDDAALPPPPAAPAPDAGAAPPPPLPLNTIITDALWKRRYGSDPGIIGQTVPIGNGNGRAHIIGVLEPGAELLFPADVAVDRQPDLFVVPRFDFANANRNNVSLRVFARLKDGVTVEQAQAQVDQIATELRQRFPIKQTAGLHFRVESMHPGLVADVQPAIVALMGAVMFVLLVACANVANLLLVRAGTREREFAVRAALGGSRRRLVRQILVESLLLAVAGAVLGLTLAEGGVRILIAIGPEDLPRLDTVSVDWNVALFAGAAAIAAAVIFGAVPAVRASRPALMDVLRSSGRTTGGGTRWLRDGVVLAEVALSFVLLIGSGLMVRSFIALQTMNPGYDYENVLTFFAPSGRQRQPEEARAFLEQVTERIKSTPGVVDVTGSSSVPLDGFNAFARWGTEEALTDNSKFQQMSAHFVRDNYFDVMRTRLVDGRAFTRSDHGENIRRIIIDSVIAEKAFGTEPAVGRRLLARVTTNEAEWYDVVGVVQHQRRVTLAEDGTGSIFFPEGHLGPGAAGRWVVRTSTEPLSALPAIRGELLKLDPTIALAQVEPMSRLVNRANAPTQFALVLIGVFAGVAVLLAAIGLYGVLAGVVRQKTSEIGVRIAFGAPTSAIFRQFIGRGLKLAALGVAMGALAALGFTRWMTSMLVGVTPADPVTFASIATLFIVIAALACWVPARRAATLSPVVALRQE